MFAARASYLLHKIILLLLLLLLLLFQACLYCSLLDSDVILHGPFQAKAVSAPLLVRMFRLRVFPALLESWIAQQWRVFALVVHASKLPALARGFSSL